MIARLRAWLRRFIRRNIVADDPYDRALNLRARYVVGRSGPPVLTWDGPITQRIIPMACWKPNEQFEMGWRVAGQNDAAIVEVLWAKWVGEHVAAR